MYRRVLTLSLATCLTALSLTAQEQAEPTLNPTVQKAEFNQKFFVKVPETANLGLDKRWHESDLLDVLRKVVKLEPNKAFSITIGVQGDKSVRAVSKFIPKRKEGYYLKVTASGVVIAGADERGLYYGLQTFRQMAEDGKLSLGAITDYPDVPYRGVVEGFYGTPWSYEDRLSQLDFYGENKLNVYIYGPKDDPYHSVPNWRKPYPEQEAKQIKSLVDRANKNRVIFYWAIHPGQDIKWNEEDRATLLKKFEHMYELGVRGFAVFFDDISGEGTKADKQAELLNYIDDNFVKVKKDVAPLIMCPTEYNKSWSNLEGGYLPTLGTKLNKGIEIMWTGNTVVATIDKPDMQWINSAIKRKGYIWFNFPVSDFVRDHLLLGETYGNSLEIADDVSGFLSNPMEHAESSKISLYSIADYTWNMKNYKSGDSWLRSFPAVFPEAPEALFTFARHSSALGANGHRFDREESVALRPRLDRLAKGEATTEDIAAISTECSDIIASVNMLLASQTNPNLIDEMKPWLKMAKLVGEYGQNVLALDAKTGYDSFVKEYDKVKAIQRLMYLVDIEENQNPYQPGVKYGSAHLVPALNAHFKSVVESVNKRHGKALSTETSYKPFTLTSSIPQLAYQPLQTRGKQVNVSPSNEVIKWTKGAEIVLTAKQAEGIQSFALDLGAKDIADKLSLAVKIDGAWKNIALSQKAGDTAISAEGIPGTEKCTAIRLVYNGTEPVELRLKRFFFTLR